MKTTLPEVSGIYSIRNTINGKTYIGSSANIRNRMKKHLADLRRGKHHSAILQRAYLKYGEQAFVVDVLEVVETNILLTKEQEYLERSRPEYNISFIACEKTRLGMKSSAAHCARMSASLKGRVGPMKGKKFSAEHKAKIAETNRKQVQRIGWKHTPEAIEKMRLARRANPSRPLRSDEAKRKTSESLRKTWALRKANSLKFKRESDEEEA